MFSGKTDELIRRVHDARAEGRRAVVLKPAIDDRHPHDVVVSHSGRQVDAVAIEGGELLAAAGDAEIVFVDEVQFFDAGLVEAVELLRTRGSDVVAAGLDLDFRREPFPTTKRLA